VCVCVCVCACMGDCMYTAMIGTFVSYRVNMFYVSTCIIVDDEIVKYIPGYLSVFFIIHYTS